MSRFSVPPWGSRLMPHLGLAVCSVAAACLMTWPLAVHTTDHILAAIYHWDAYTNTMIMGGRVDAALGRSALSLYDNYFFAPLPNTLAFNENLFGLSLLFAPFYLLSNNALFAYNATLLLSLALSVFFTQLLVKELTGSRLAGLVVGVAFAFCPYVLFEIGRLQLVATQWIPACFLMLHRAVGTGRWRDVLALGAFYLLQVGSCLYYAMFLIPLLGFVGVTLLVNKRPARSLYVKLAVSGALTAGVALLMVYPYFAARAGFDLERTLEFASSYDGKLSFFANVHETNRTLTSLHHRGEYRGAHEEIAFPGFTLLGLTLIAIGVPLWRAVRTARTHLPLGSAQWGSFAKRGLGWATVPLMAVLLTWLTHSLLAGVVVLGGGLWFNTRRRSDSVLFGDSRRVYLAVLLLAIVLFLGLTPFEWGGKPVHGLYYYFHTYFPGFNGIRKVSRQAVMTSFVLAVVAGHGAAWLLQRWPAVRHRVLVTVLLVGFVCFELRSFPHPVRSVWAGETMPPAYAYLAQRPRDELVVAYPQNNGQHLFKWDHGLALHNYLMLQHKHRSLNGQSSWEPPVTNLVNRALAALPDDGARRVLLSVGARHLLIHGDELNASQQRLVDQLRAAPSLYHHAFQSGNDHVFTFVDASDAATGLTPTPELPAHAVAIASTDVALSSASESHLAYRAFDGDLSSHWSSRQQQFAGQQLEFRLSRARRVVALEIQNPTNESHVPMGYDLAIADEGGSWRTVWEQPQLRVPHDLVYAPKRAIFRVVFPDTGPVTRVKLTIRQPVPGAPLIVHEARLYALDQ